MVITIIGRERDNMGRRELIDIAGCLHAETEKAILFSDTADAKDAKWIPKSQCEFVGARPSRQRRGMGMTLIERLEAATGPDRSVTSSDGEGALKP
jgi:hypothetical protein